MRRRRWLVVLVVLAVLWVAWAFGGIPVAEAATTTLGSHRWPRFIWMLGVFVIPVLGLYAVAKRGPRS